MNTGRHKLTHSTTCETCGIQLGRRAIYSTMVGVYAWRCYPTCGAEREAPMTSPMTFMALEAINAMVETFPHRVEADGVKLDFELFFLSADHVAISYSGHVRGRLLHTKRNLTTMQWAMMDAPLRRHYAGEFVGYALGHAIKQMGAR